MKLIGGSSDRTHFRLDVEEDNMGLAVLCEDGKTFDGYIKDISNGGLSFSLMNATKKDFDCIEVTVSFVIESRPFTFGFTILRKYTELGKLYYAGKFSDNSMLKKSQLSLLLMKLKLTCDNEGK